MTHEFASILVHGEWIDVRFDNEFDLPRQIIQRKFRDRMSASHGLVQLNFRHGTDFWVKPSAVGAVKFEQGS